MASFADRLHDTSAFFDFIHREEINQASYATSLLRIIAESLFCETLVKRASWRVAHMLQQISEEKLYAPPPNNLFASWLTKLSCVKTA